jgi:hypothetical protein
MADAITLEQLLERGKKLEKMADEAAKETDPDKALANAQSLQAEGHALEDMGRQFREQELKKRRGGKGIVTVVLTAEQRKKIHAETGIVVEQLEIDDEAGALNRAMPVTDPALIEFYGMKEALRRKVAKEADARIRTQLEQMLRDLENVGVAELQELPAKLKADPNFLGGLLQKKPE